MTPTRSSPPQPTSCSDLKDRDNNRDRVVEAFAVLRDNDRGNHSVPTQGLYPVQFNWDSAFAALGYRLLNPDRAWRELESLLSAQWDDGMIPHIAFRGEHEGYFPGPDVWRTTKNPPTSGITQPPVAALATRRIHQLHGNPNPPARLDNLIRRLARWHEWFAECRRCPQTGAALIVHPWESGRDNLPDWDAAMGRIVPRNDLGEYRRADLNHVAADQRPRRADYDRYLTLVRFGADLNWAQKRLGMESPFRMLDPLMTAVLARAERDLAQLATERNLSDIAAAAQTRAAQWTDGFRALWNPELKAFVSRDPDSGVFANSITAASFLGPLAGVAEDEFMIPTQERFDRMTNSARFMLPSLDPTHPGFDSRRYWRGPVWLVVNRLVAWGFADAGDSMRAEKLRSDSAELVAASGFSEYYDPHDGTGLGGGRFTWTAAVFLDWAAGEGD